MAAGKKPLAKWGPQDIGADTSKIGAAGARMKMLKLFIPVREAKCEIIEGENDEEMAINLALKLRAVKLI